MFSTLRNRFGIPGVISVIALVFAMLGGAYAAQSNGGGKATASAKAKKGPRGPKGAIGPTGPAGPQGPAGANGKDGANGTNGANGTPGAPGTDGKSVAVTEIGPGASECEEHGGALVEKEDEPLSAIEVCNGAEGSPWTAGGTLPSGATETGAFAAAGETYTPITLPIPLAAPIGTTKVDLAPDPDCPGTTEVPKAASGHFCMYLGHKSGGFIGPYPVSGAEATTAGVATTGAFFIAEGEAWGSWAVTAP